MERTGVIVLCAFVLSILHSFCAADPNENGLLVLTVATEETDGFRRFLRSARIYNLNVEVLGMGEEWTGGDVLKFPGGAQKIILLRRALEALKEQPDRVVMFVDSYDVVFTDGESEILRVFAKMNARVVFSAESFCWPDGTLAEKYPPVKVTEARFLNSGGFIGYVPELYKIVTSSSVNSEDDDQLFYTNIYLNEALRTSLSMKLDTRSELFQNLNGAYDDVSLKFKGSSSYLYNSKTGNIPIVVHGNGPSKILLNSLSNYIANQWSPNAGCQGCNEGTIDLSGVKSEDMPQVMIGIFFEQPTPFADVFFDYVSKLDYPKNKIDLFIHIAVKFHERHLEAFMSDHGVAYHSATVYKPDNELKPRAARNRALEECLKRDCSYYLSLDGITHLENDQTLKLLIERNRSVIAPMLVRKGQNNWWSNFWGAINGDGYYLRSDDYIDILQGERSGIWNVPYITAAYLLHRSHVPALIGGFHRGDVDSDMAICQHMREKGVFMYVDNQISYGVLVNNDEFDTSHLHNDLYEIFNNQYAWERKYVNAEYYHALDPATVNPQPCPDVYWFPAVSVKFCEDYIAEVEHFGQWSGGRNNRSDPRLAGGYENVPTVDIHTNQIGWEPHWLHFLKIYVAPLNQKVFLEYYTESRAIMNFVVRYKPGEQDRLRAHHDSSTFTINIALNRAQIDYEGGGPRFIRYNCSMANTRQGWMLMHPGRLTHLHEGMPVTKGTRYIMVSFVDP